MRYSRKIIENSIKHYSRLLRENNQNQHGDQYITLQWLMEKAMDDYTLPNWAKTPMLQKQMFEYARTRNLMYSNNIFKSPCPTAYLFQNIIQGQLTGHEIHKVKGRDYRCFKSIGDFSGKGWFSMNDLYETQIQKDFKCDYFSTPLWTILMYFCPKLDDRMIDFINIKKREKKLGSNYVFFEMSDPDSIDASAFYTVSIGKVTPIDENGVIG